MRSVLAFRYQWDEVFFMVILVVAIGITQAVEATLTLAHHDVKTVKSIERSVTAGDLHLELLN